MSLPLRWGRWRALVAVLKHDMKKRLTAGRAGKSSFLNSGEVPPTLFFFTQFAASLGALARLGRRAEARLLTLVTARRAVKRISWLAGVDTGKQTERRNNVITDGRGRGGNPRRKAFWRTLRDPTGSGPARSDRNRRDIV